MITDIIHVVLALPSQHQIFGIFSTVFCIAAAWVYSHAAKKLKTTILQTISWLAVFNEIVFQLYMIYYGIWSYRTSMPLEMCYLSALLVPVYTRFQHYRSLQNWFFFAGFGGSFFALINTNLSEVAQTYMSIHYFFAHGIVIFVMLVLVIDGYRPRWVDYFNAIQWTTVLVVSIIIINLILGSNYMFTFEKPPGMNFTSLMPEWPYYFMIILFIGLMFYTLLMLLSLLFQQKEDS